MYNHPAASARTEGRTGSAEERALVQRYTQQLNEQEDRLAALHSQIADFQAKRQQASDQLDKILAEISLDESF